MLREDKQSRDAHRIPFESLERDPCGPRRNLTSWRRKVSSIEAISDLSSIDDEGPGRRVPRRGCRSNRDRQRPKTTPPGSRPSRAPEGSRPRFHRVGHAPHRVLGRGRRHASGPSARSSASTPARIRRIVRTGMPAIRPRSNNETSPWLTPTRWPRSTCTQMLAMAQRATDTTDPDVFHDRSSGPHLASPTVRCPTPRNSQVRARPQIRRAGEDRCGRCPSVDAAMKSPGRPQLPVADHEPHSYPAERRTIEMSRHARPPRPGWGTLRGANGWPPCGRPQRRTCERGQGDDAPAR